MHIFSMSVRAYMTLFFQALIMFSQDTGSSAFSYNLLCFIHKVGGVLYVFSFPNPLLSPIIYYVYS